MGRTPNSLGLVLILLGWGLPGVVVGEGGDRVRPASLDISFARPGKLGIDGRFVGDVGPVARITVPATPGMHTLSFGAPGLFVRAFVAVCDGQTLKLDCRQGPCDNMVGLANGCVDCSRAVCKIEGIRALTRSEVNDLFRSIHARVEACGRIGVGRKGTITMRTTIDGLGLVQSAFAEPGSLDHTAAQSCVEEEVRKLRFPCRGGFDLLEVVYPFVLS